MLALTLTTLGMSLGPINSGNFDGAPTYRLNRECALLAASSPYTPPDCAD